MPEYRTDPTQQLINKIMARAFEQAKTESVRAGGITAKRVNSIINRAYLDFTEHLGDRDKTKKIISRMINDMRADFKKAFSSAYNKSYETSFNIYQKTLTRPYRAAILRVNPEIVSSETLEKAIRDELFRPPSAEAVEAMMLKPLWRTGVSWGERMSQVEHKWGFADGAISDVVSYHIQQGDNPREAAETLRNMLAHDLDNPLIVEDPTGAGIRLAFNKYRSWAMTVARSEMLSYHQLAYLESCEDFKDVLEGQQYLATLDKRTRPWHAKWDKEIGYYNPQPGQRPLSDLPNPPWEYNCRCTWVPVVIGMEALRGIGQRPSITPAGRSRDERWEYDPMGEHGMLHKPWLAKVQPGKTDFATWFDKLGRESKQSILQSPKRLELVEQVFGKDFTFKQSLDKRGHFWRISDLKGMVTERSKALVVPPAPVSMRGVAGKNIRTEILQAKTKIKSAIETTKSTLDKSFEQYNKEIKEIEAKYTDEITRKTELRIIGRKFTKEFEQYGHELSELYKQQEKITKETFDLLAIKKGELPKWSINHVKGGNIGKTRKDFIGETMQDIGKLIKGIADKNPDTTKINIYVLKSTESKRASYNTSTKTINLSTSYFKLHERQRISIAHEFGHHLEHNNPEIYKMAKEFLDKRGAGETPTFLNDLQPDRKYDKTEKVFKDKFLDPYCGKIYSDNSTEIVSMGLQYLTENPGKFADEDPEYFDLMIDILHGVWE